MVVGDVESLQVSLMRNGDYSAGLVINKVIRVDVVLRKTSCDSINYFESPTKCPVSHPVNYKI